MMIVSYNTIITSNGESRISVVIINVTNVKRGKKKIFCEEKMRGRKKNYSTFKSKNNFDW